MVLTIALSGWGGGWQDAQAANFAPHRAIYDISLLRSEAGSGVADLDGRMVYELQGNACEGYTQNMRFVTRIEDRDGAAQINDLRTSTWEADKGKRLRFNLSQYQNDNLAEAIEGDADRVAGTEKAPVEVELSKPDQKSFKLQPGVFFPMQHSMKLLEAAKRGERVFSARLFDGSEKGEKVYFTGAYIGDRQPPAAAQARLPDAVATRLGGFNAWPVAISYFEPGKERSDAPPSYELSFLYFENGVSSRLTIDYGDFAISGELSELKMLPPGDCAR